MVLDLVFVYPNTLVIRTRVADQNVYKIVNVIDRKHVLTINAKIHVLVFVESTLFVVFKIMHQIVSVILVIRAIQRSLVIDMK